MVFRKELLPGVSLTCVKSDKFKTSCLSFSLMIRLSKENASQNALISRVLRRGSSRLPDMESITAALDIFYGASLNAVVRKRGDVQIVGLISDFIDDAYVPGDERLLESVASVMGEMLLSPNTRGGLFLPNYVDSEKGKLLDDIAARVNEKRSYSMQRLIENMCLGEDYSVDKLGSGEEAESITYTKLTRRYKELLAESRIEVFYCGSADSQRVFDAVRDALEGIPRGMIKNDLSTDIILTPRGEDVRYFTEELDVSQGKLAVGFRMGDCMKNPDLAAIRVMNAAYGGSVTSKLFMNVRERLSLCYFASSMTDWHKGVMLVSSGIEFDKYDRALEEILAQLENMKNGEITDEELNAARRYVAASLRASLDSPLSLEDFYLSQSLYSAEYGPEELAALCEDVTKDDVVSIARGIACDSVYFLRGLTATEV